MGSGFAGVFNFLLMHWTLLEGRTGWTNVPTGKLKQNGEKWRKSLDAERVAEGGAVSVHVQCDV